jgi:hypothetical protein
VRSRDPGESTFVGRLTIVMTIKMIAMLVSIGVSAVAILLVWHWVAQSSFLVGVVAFGSLACCCIPVVHGVARSFENFDVAGQAAE